MMIHPGFLLLGQPVDFLCDGAVGLVDAAAVAAVHIYQFAVFCDQLHHPALVQYPAVAADKFFLTKLAADAKAKNTDIITLLKMHIPVIEVTL